jgi:uncharacterized cupin superfamily protein
MEYITWHKTPGEERATTQDQEVVYHNAIRE